MSYQSFFNVATAVIMIICI